MYHRNLEFKAVVRRIAGCAPRVEVAPGCATHIAAGRVLLCEPRRKDAGIDGAILERGGVFVEIDEVGKARAGEGDERLYTVCSTQIAFHAAGDDNVHHQPMAEAVLRGAQDLL